MLCRRSIFIGIFILNFTTFAKDATRNTTRLTVSGVILPVFTPFKDDLSVNLDIIPEYAKYFAKLNLKSILVGGTTGEQMTLTMEERADVLKAWVKVANELGLKIIAQVGGGPLINVYHLAKYAEELGVSAILTLPELYYRPNTVDELVDYVKLVANAAPKTPILYYHHPKKSNVQLPMPEFVRIATAQIPNFKGLKFTSSNLNEAYSTLRNLHADQDLILASPTVLVGAATLGFKSVTAGSFNLFPKQYLDIMSAVAMKDMSRARSIQEKITRAVDFVGQKGRIPKLKAAMKIVTGLDMGPPRLPMKPASKEVLKKLKELFQELGFLNYN